MTSTTLTRRALSLFLCILLFCTEAIPYQHASTLHTHVRESLPLVSVQVDRPLFNGDKSFSQIRSAMIKAAHGLGTIQEGEQLSQSDNRWILNIKDIHGNFEAQKNIELFLDRLVKSGLAELIFLEGSSEPIDISLFVNPPDQSLLNKSADFLLQEGLVSGPGHYVLTHASEAPPMLGLEDKNLYQENIQALQDGAGNIRLIYPRLIRLERELQKLKKRHFSPDLQIVDSGMRRYMQGKMSLASVVSFFRHRGVSDQFLTEFFLRSELLPSLIDSKLVQKELSSWIQTLSKHLSNEETVFLMKSMESFQVGLINSKEYYSLLLRFSEKKGVSLAPFANAIAQLNYIAVHESLTSIDFGTVIQNLHSQLLNQLAPSREEREILQLSQTLHLLKKYLAFSITPDEWKVLSSNQKKSAGASATFNSINNEISWILRHLSHQRDFYKLADRRSHIFYERIVSGLSGKNKKTAIFISGGFHSDVTAKFLVDEGFSFLSFTPAISSPLKNNKSSLVSFLSHRNEFDSFVFDAQTLAPPPVPRRAFAYIGFTAMSEGLLTQRSNLVQWGQRIITQIFPGMTAIVRRSILGRTPGVLLENKNGHKVLTFFRSGKIIIQDIFSFKFLWNKLRFFWYSRMGLRIKGVGLHNGKPVTIRIFPRKAGNGINFFRTDLPDRTDFSVVPAHLNFLRRNRLRFSGIENMGLQIATVEHLLFSLRVLGIWDADIEINGEEVPILDGSAEKYLRILSRLPSSDKQPEVHIYERAHAFVRDDNTALIVLPLPEEADSEFFFVGNYPGYNIPIESHIIFREGDSVENLIATMGNRQTFVERPLRELQKQRRFLGAIPVDNIIQLKGIDQLRKEPKLARDIAEHKGGIDFIGDLSLIEHANDRRFKGILIGLGTGHRDTAELMYQIHSSYQLPVDFDRIFRILDRLRENNKISDAMFSKIRTLIETHRKKEEIGDKPREFFFNDFKGAVNFKYIGNFQGHGLAGAFEAAKNYLLAESGEILKEIAQSVATQVFIAFKVKEVTFELIEETDNEYEFLVSFVRAKEGKDIDWPKVKLVVSKPGAGEYIRNEWEQTKKGARIIETQYRQNQNKGYVERKAADQQMEFFPKVGQLWRDPGNPDQEVYVYSEEVVKEYATVVPMEEMTSTGAGFKLKWKTGDVTEPFFWQELNTEQKENVALGVAEMMTTVFLRSRGADNPDRGDVIKEIDFTRDLIFDPIDQKVGLASIHGFEQSDFSSLLDKIFYIKHERKRRYEDVREVRDEKSEWQFLAPYRLQLVQGVVKALIKEEGELKGRITAQRWFESYKDYFTKRTKPSTFIEPKVDYLVRTMIFQGKQQTPGFQIDAPISVKDVIFQVLIELEHTIQDLESESRSDATKASAFWLASGLALLTGAPSSLWIRLSPITETIVFVGGGYLLSSVLSASVGVPIFNALIVFLMIQIFWIYSHQRIWFSSHTEGELFTEQWESVGDFDTTEGKIDFRDRQRKIILAGFLLASGPAALSVLIPSSLIPLLGFFTVFIHTLFNERGNIIKRNGFILPWWIKRGQHSSS